MFAYRSLCEHIISKLVIYKCKKQPEPFNMTATGGGAQRGLMLFYI